MPGILNGLLLLIAPSRHLLPRIRNRKPAHARAGVKAVGGGGQGRLIYPLRKRRCSTFKLLLACTNTYMNLKYTTRYSIEATATRTPSLTCSPSIRAGSASAAAAAVHRIHRAEQLYLEFMKECTHTTDTHPTHATREGRLYHTVSSRSISSNSNSNNNNAASVMNSTGGWSWKK